jgi:membrane protein implicated in regulation of membrane protease activity
VPSWLIWLLVSAGLVVAELFSLDLVLIMLATGALAAGGAAALGAPLVVQALVFAIVSVLALFGVRPVVRRRLENTTAETKHGIEALKGADALVLARVDEHSGLVKIGGEEWTARAYDATQVLEPGQKVQVVDIKGATALVWRLP